MSHSSLNAFKPRFSFSNNPKRLPVFWRLLLSFLSTFFLALVSRSSCRRLQRAARFRRASPLLSLLVLGLVFVSRETAGLSVFSSSGVLAPSEFNQPSAILMTKSVRPLTKRACCSVSRLALGSLSSRTCPCTYAPILPFSRESCRSTLVFCAYLHSGKFPDAGSRSPRKDSFSTLSERRIESGSAFVALTHGRTTRYLLPGSPRCSNVSSTASRSLSTLSRSDPDPPRLETTAHASYRQAEHGRPPDRLQNLSDESVALHAIMACGGVGSRFGGETPKQFVPLFRGQTAAQISLEKLRRHLARSGAGCPEASTRRQFQQETDEREFPKAKKRGQSFLVAVVDRERRAAVMKRSTNEEETENCEARGRMAATGAGSEGGDQCLDGLNEHDISLGHVSTRSNPLHGREGRDDHRRTPVEVLFAPVGAERWESVWHGVKCLCYSLLATEKGRKLREISAPVLRSDTNPSLREGHVGNEKESTHGQSRSRFRSLCRALSSLPRYVASAFMSKFHYVVPGGSQLAPDTTQVACNSARMNAGGLQTGSKGNVSEVATAQADEARHLLHRLAAINCDKDLVMIHDAARPCVREEDLENVTSDAEKFGAALLAVPAVSSIKVATADRHGRLCPASPCSGEKSVTRGKDPTAADRDKATGHEDFFVQRTLPRHLLWEAQTPQVIRLDLLLSGYDAFWTQLATKSLRKQQELRKASLCQSHAAGHCTQHKVTTEEQVAGGSSISALCEICDPQESPTEMPTVTDDTGLLEFLWSDERAFVALPGNDSSKRDVLSTVAAGDTRSEARDTRSEEVIKVKVRKSDSRNIKITLPIDYTLAQLILHEQSEGRPAQIQ